MSSNSVTSLIYFLAFGFLFYWMMKKGGCGVHAHGHAHHERARESQEDGPADQQRAHHHGS